MNEKDIGVLSAQLFEAKQRKADLNDEIKELNKKILGLQNQLLHSMQHQGLHQVKNAFGTVFIARQIVPKVVNWNEFYEYIIREKRLDLLERRPSRAAFREEHESGFVIPGVDPVEFDEVRTRKT